MPNPVADILRRAAELNIRDPRRHGSLVRLRDGVEVLVAGDIHGRREELAKVIAYAAVDRFPHRRLILQEIIHGLPDARTGHDRSIELLMRVARLKVACPDQVLFILSNHDVAQITGSEITKSGRRVCKAFAEGVRFAFGDAAPDILAAVNTFLRSLPLAIRCPGGVMISHSVPGPARMELAGVDVLLRPIQEEDLRRGGAAYEWTWGRKQTDEQLDKLSEMAVADFFVPGHRKLDVGFEPLGKRAASLTSDNNNGCIMQFGANTALTADNVADHVRPIATLRPL